MQAIDISALGAPVRRTVVALALVGAFASSANAAPISGVFDISGILSASSNTITWTSPSPSLTPSQATIGSGPSGSFAALGSTNVTIDTLNYVTEPVGGLFPAQLFLTFLDSSASSFPGLQVNHIDAGIDSSTACGLAPAVGQVCTPIVPGSTSPFDFQNLPPPGAIQSTLTFSLSGVTSDGDSSWVGNFTSQFNVPFQEVLAAAAANNGTFSNTYSATISVTADQTTPPSVPEPETLSLFAIGLGLLAATARGLKSTG